MKTWVNVYRGQYAGSTDGSKVYFSLGYKTKKAAIKALKTPRGKANNDRYIKTIKIEL